MTLTTWDFGDRRGWVPAHKHPNGGGWVDDTATVDATAIISPYSAVGHHVIIESGVVVGQDVTIGGHTHVWSGAIIGRDVVIGSSVIIGADVIIGEDVIIEAGAIIGPYSAVEHHAVIEAGVVVGPRVAILAGSIIEPNSPMHESVVTSATARLPVPVIENIDAAILAAVRKNSLSGLQMSMYHTCETCHCRAGWAIHLAGPAGYALEEEHGPWIAGALIYQASRPGVPIPDFYCYDAPAMADLTECAAEQTN